MIVLFPLHFQVVVSVHGHTTTHTHTVCLYLFNVSCLWFDHCRKNANALYSRFTYDTEIWSNKKKTEKDTEQRKRCIEKAREKKLMLSHLYEFVLEKYGVSSIAKSNICILIRLQTSFHFISTKSKRLSQWNIYPLSLGFISAVFIATTCNTM